jgi:hypothetical protein
MGFHRRFTIVQFRSSLIVSWWAGVEGFKVYTTTGFRRFDRKNEVYDSLQGQGPFVTFQ